MRELFGAVREGVIAVRAAASENRGVVRSSCAALEQIARRGIAITRELRQRTVAVWQPFAYVGPVATSIIYIVTLVGSGMLSILATAMVVCDVLLNTARTERLG